MLTWVEPHQPLPPATRARREPNGLLAAGRDLSAPRLLEAYGKGIFPWYSAGQPVLWWSPDPRMVVFTAEFSPSRSLRKTLRKIARPGGWTISLDRDFRAVMQACASHPRPGQDGTWITPAIVDAYVDLHRMGHAHSFEVRADGALIAGLYGVSIGRMFFGESMFTRVPDGSKCAYAALVATLRSLDMPMIDCQQSTSHLASLGGRDITRVEFLDRIVDLARRPAPDWRRLTVEWPLGSPDV
ncbi:MAG: leucyl/phenylalanyl-tRNA--protein transferase [Lautropia sp.]